MKIKTLLTAAAALALSVGASFGQNSLDAFFANTVVMTSAEGAEMKILINADNTYTGTAPDGTAIAGVWELNEAGEACFTRQQPEAMPQVCNALGGQAVGDTWEGTTADGTPVTMTLVEGR